MNAAHIHLMLNHVPVVGAIVIALLLAAAWLMHNEGVLRLALWGAVADALIAIVVYLTGGAAEEMVENLPGISHTLIEEHEEAALVATIVLGVFGAAALAALLLYRRRTIPPRVHQAALLLSLIPIGFMVWTSNLGGLIRHTEIRGGQAVPSGSEMREQSEEPSR